MAWDEERIAELERLWTEGYSTAEIGRRLDISKNAVVGKAHRLGLSSRPSPIKRSSQPRKSKPRTVQLEDLGPNMCRWPHGDPGDPDFQFCGKPIVPGKPYCEEHCQRAYVQPGKSSQNDDAA